jgi:hypothetical protein
MPNPTTKASRSIGNPAEARTPSDGKAPLNPEQLAFAELVGSLLAAKWRREHQQNSQPPISKPPATDASD